MDASPKRLLNLEASVAQSSAVVSASLFLTALLGAGQALLLAFIVGEGDKTDAFLAAYSLYLVVALFGASLRGSLLPLFGGFESEDTFRERTTDVLSRIITIGLIVLVLLLVISPLAGQLMTLGLPPHARWTAVAALLILSPAAYLQIRAAAMSAALSAARRFSLSAALYVLAGVLALACSAVMLALIGVLGAAVGLLVGAVVLAAGHGVYLRRFQVAPHPRLAFVRERQLGTLAKALVAGAAIGLALQVNLALSLAVLSSDPGAITAYSYAFFLVTMMLTVSSTPLSLVTMPDLVGRVAARGMEAAEEQLRNVAPYAFAVLAPLALGYVAYGEPLLQTIFGGSLSDKTIALLYDLGLILEGTLIPNTLLFLTGAVTLALRRWGKFLLVGAVSVAIQALLVISLSTFGPKAVAGGHVATSAITAGLLLAATYARAWPGVAIDALRRSLPAFALAAVIPLTRLPLGSDPGFAAALGGLAVGLGAYTILAVALWPSVSSAFVGLIRRSGKTA
jgi:peptidoglycan biosynthesis protein MviN/MurJ (putative lipid II flippase)